MSRAGTPKARAAKAYDQALAAAREEYKRRIQPALDQYARAVAPHQKWLREQQRAAAEQFREERDRRKATSDA